MSYTKKHHDTGIKTCFLEQPSPCSLYKSLYPPNPRHKSASELSRSEGSSARQPRASETPPSSQNPRPRSISFSTISLGSVREQTLRPQRNWSWIASSDFTHFPPFEQAHHRWSTETVRSIHGDHWYTQVVWHSESSTPEGVTHLLTPLGERVAF
jgi:hypothetical protein